MGKLSIIGVEGQWHTHRRERLLKFCLAAGGEAGHQDVHLMSVHPVELVFYPLGRQTLNDVIHGLALVGQQYKHGIAAAAVGQPQRLAHVVLAV